jgi:hypothetical protein
MLDASCPPRGHRRRWGFNIAWADKKEREYGNAAFIGKRTCARAR